MVNFKRKWFDLSFSKKLKLSYFLIILIPVLVLGGFSYISSISYVRKQIDMETDNSVEKVTSEIETNLQQSQSSLSLIVNNYSFQEFLSSSNQLSAYELNKIANSYIGPMLYNVMLSNKYIDKVEIYSEDQITVLPDLIKVTHSIIHTDWYEQTIKSDSYFWNYENSRLYLNKSIKHSITGDFLGIARIRIKQELFTKSFYSFINTPQSIKVIAHNNDVVFEDGRGGNSKLYHVNSRIPTLNWEIDYEFKRPSVSSLSGKRLIANYTIIILCLIFVGIIIHYISKSLLKRVFLLVHQMQEVREGNLDIVVDTSYNDEIGSLAQSFQSMITQINKLIKERYISNLRQKELELYLLQAKVNPHFLYNILSTINWLALENNQTKISQITTNLATFYRTTLNKGQEFNFLENEFSNIKSYIELQLIARENSFDVSYDISNKLSQEKVPNFILQPLVENAIEHGIDNLRHKKGWLCIYTLSFDKYYQIIIADNGQNLFEEYGESFLEKSKYGYGLKNVNERIKLYSNDNFGVKLSICSKGTKAILTLPYT